MCAIEVTKFTYQMNSHQTFKLGHFKLFVIHRQLLFDSAFLNAFVSSYPKVLYIKEVHGEDPWQM